MRVLHCYSGNLYGGIETMLVTLARCRDLEPSLHMEYALCFQGRLADELHSAGATVHDLKPVRLRQPWTVCRARRHLARLLNEDSFDVLVTHACWSHAMLGPAARRVSRPLVFWQRDLAGERSWTERMASWTRPDLVLSNSRYTAATLPRLFTGVPVEVIYNPVTPPTAHTEAEAVRSEVRQELNTPESAAVVILACRMERWKGHTLLLEALGHLHQQPGWMAWIVGGAQRPHEQAYLEELRAQAVSVGIADRVRFLGQRYDVRRLMAAADVHCQPNLAAEPFGNVYIEALYAGLPVVSTRMGGAAEIVTDACGVLVEPGDVDALTRVLGTLFADPSTRACLGAAGPLRAAELCDPAGMLVRLRTLLEGITGVAAVVSKTNLTA